MNYEIARANMLRQQIQTCNVFDQKILELLATVPREHFMPDQYKLLAYADMPVPLKNGRHLFTPKEEALILQTLQATKNDTVLEVGSGNGYLTTLLASLARQVYSIDIDPNITQDVERKLVQFHIKNVTLHTGDAEFGWNRYAPYQVILVNGSLAKLPIELRNNLAVGGRLFVVLGNPPAMQATLIKHTTPDEWANNVLFETCIDPL